ncbi:hypothetical protein ACOME3_009699 [Neoechinorhynchus agilis]
MGIPSQEIPKSLSCNLYTPCRPIKKQFDIKKSVSIGPSRQNKTLSTVLLKLELRCVGVEAVHEAAAGVTVQVAELSLPGDDRHDDRRLAKDHPRDQSPQGKHPQNVRRRRDAQSLHEGSQSPPKDQSLQGEEDHPEDRRASLRCDGLRQKDRSHRRDVERSKRSRLEK